MTDDRLAAIALSHPEPLTLVTLLHVEGSAYRRPPARMLVDRAKRSWGSVAGGCLESTVIDTAARCASARIESFDTGRPDDLLFGYGLGCAGRITLLFEPCGVSLLHLPLVAAAAAARERLLCITAVGRDDGATRVARVVAGNNGVILQSTGDPALDAALTGHSSSVQGAVAGSNLRVFVETIEPPMQLLIFGAGNDSIPLAESATALGWKPVVIDRREAWLDARRYPAGTRLLCAAEAEATIRYDRRTLAVLMTHNYPADVAILTDLQQRALPYVGIVGSRRRFSSLLDELQLSGAADVYLRTLHGPAGIDLGSSDPAEIALAILAEASRVVSGAGGESLRDAAPRDHHVVASAPFEQAQTVARCES